MELLPEETPFRENIIALVEEHDTPCSWHRQFLKGGVIPAPKAWLRLGRKVCTDDPANGIIVLALFKVAYIDGHEDTSDVVWFFEHANDRVLSEHNRELPVPTQNDLVAFK
jgi:hypothetical protein